MQIHREVKWSSAAKKEEESQGLGRQVPWAKLARVICSGGRSLHFRAFGSQYHPSLLSATQFCPELSITTQWLPNCNRTAGANFCPLMSCTVALDRVTHFALFWAKNWWGGRLKRKLLVTKFSSFFPWLVGFFIVCSTSNNKLLWAGCFVIDCFVH